MPDDRFIHRRAGHSDKVSKLSDLEYRVWTQYLLSADDFGVMRASAVTLQADNDCLDGRPAKSVQRALEAVISSTLVDTFEHQNRRYVFQRDWQSWQKVAYPRPTNQPKPPDEALATCDAHTQRLFSIHPGGAGRKRGDGSQNVPQTVSEGSSLMRAGAPAKRLTANGQRLTAHGSEGGPGEVPPMDEWARELVNLYPAQGRCGWNLVEQPLYVVLTSDPAVSPWQAWVDLKVRLEGHRRSHQWRVKQMIPRLDRYLRDGAHLQELPEHPVSTLVTDKTVRSMSSAVDFIKDGTRGA